MSARILPFMAMVLMIVGAGSARAAEADEDQQHVCPVMTAELARKAAEQVSGTGPCRVSCKGCGCKGGPGYRGPRGCVSWADLIRVCGPPPHEGCTRECAIVRPGCHGRAWLKVFAAGLGLTSALTFAPSQLPEFGQAAEGGAAPQAPISTGGALRDAAGPPR